METRFLTTPCELRGDKTPTLIGLASVVYDGTPGTEYALEPDVVERFAPGAFDEWLATMPEVSAFFNHDNNKLLARTPDTLKVWADSRGVHYEAQLDETSWSKDLQILVRNGKIKGSSFGFLPDKVVWERDGSKDVRLVTRARLFEVSPVYKPAYSHTQTALRELQAHKDKELMGLYEMKLAEILKTVG